MTVGDAVRERIRELCKEHGIMIGRNHSVTVSTIKKLCDGLEISIRDFLILIVSTILIKK